MDVPWTIVGHSERRKIFGETNEDVAKKVKEALNNNIKVIYCISETSMDRDMGHEHFMNSLKDQLRTLLEILAPEQWVNIVLSYEPIWALSKLPDEKEIEVNQEVKNGLVSNQEIQDVHKMIRGFIDQEVGSEISKYLRIIYGGPVSKANASGLIQMKDVDGFLVHDEPSLTSQF